ncbi:MAG TPA: hypothetical protein VJP86_18205 [Vicinamibacterales bacterium]|nr:hypothetical protein [Vicinamibacterales bacterium]
MRRHLRIGWWTLLIFAALGFLLETLHGFKVRAYLDASNETRRLMWTLAHAHGTLLAIVHLAYAFTLRATSETSFRQAPIVSRSLVGASILLPGGFFLGGIRFYAGDPGIGVLLVPVGAALLLVAVFLVAKHVGGQAAAPAGKPGDRSSSRQPKG